MDVGAIEKALAEEMVLGWDIVPTGGGILITTNWRMPNKERIEIHVRSVGEREDLYLVTDGGELFNMMFLHGWKLSEDKEGADLVAGVAESHGAKVVDGQIVKGANDGNLGQAVRLILEAVKEASFLLWGKKAQGPSNLH